MNIRAGGGALGQEVGKLGHDGGELGQEVGALG